MIELLEMYTLCVKYFKQNKSHKQDIMLYNITTMYSGAVKCIYFIALHVYYVIAIVIEFKKYNINVTSS